MDGRTPIHGRRTRFSAWLVVAGAALMTPRLGPVVPAQAVDSAADPPPVHRGEGFTFRRPHTATTIGDSPELRVRLARDLDEITLDCDGELHIGEWRAGRARGRAFASPVHIRLIRSHFSVRDSRGKTARYSAAHPLEIDAPAAPLRFNDIEYPGAFVLQTTTGADSFDLIEHVSIEQYLPGVLTRELYPAWSPQTFEAQAVAARSYAMHERERRIANNDYFDVESTTQDQAYGGAGASDKARNAVNATRGVILTYQGATLRSYYSSTCGGRPGSARDTWPIGRGFEFNLAAPIQGVARDCPCDFSPRHRWTVERSTSEVVRRLRAFGAEQGMAIRNVHSIKKIESIRHNAAQRPAVYQITDNAGATWRLSAEELRLALNHNGASGLGRPEKDKVVWSGDVEIVIDDDRMTITGRGFGHGVGMCQFGAEGLARQGRTAEQILMHYYPGAEFKRMMAF